MSTRQDRLDIQLVGFDRVLRRIDGAIELLDEPRELLDAIGATLEANVQLRFDLKQDASGAAWPALSEATRAAYERRYQGSIPGSLLERSRGMRNSLTRNATDEYVEVGFSKDYAGYHVTGTRKMPRRDPLFGVVNQEGTQGELGEQDARDVEAVLDEWLGRSLA